MEPTAATGTTAKVDTIHIQSKGRNEDSDSHHLCMCSIIETIHRWGGLLVIDRNKISNRAPHTTGLINPLHDGKGRREDAEECPGNDNDYET